MAEQNDALLCARVGDLVRRAQGGEVVYTPFLTPREQRVVQEKYAFLRERLLPLGGYAEAERRRVYLLPPYMGELDADVRDEILADTVGESLVALSIVGSGYRELSHRDFLGAVLNLGIERDAIGDICVLSPTEAVLFTDRLMVEFLKESFTRVARDAVLVKEALLPKDFNGGKQFVPVTDTVASPRADAVVAALCNLSRERAKAMLAAGLVEVDYEPLQKFDKEVCEGAVITVRGHGKFIVRSLSDKTKKGRYRLVADRYV